MEYWHTSQITVELWSNWSLLLWCSSIRFYELVCHFVMFGFYMLSQAIVWNELSLANFTISRHRKVSKHCKALHRLSLYSFVKTNNILTLCSKVQLISDSLSNTISTTLSLVVLKSLEVPLFANVCQKDAYQWLYHLFL